MEWAAAMAAFFAVAVPQFPNFSGPDSVLRCSAMQHKSSTLSPSQTISLHLPRETSERLERAAKAARRSRSFPIKEALDKHLEAISRKQATAE